MVLSQRSCGGNLKAVDGNTVREGLMSDHRPAGMPARKNLGLQRLSRQSLRCAQELLPSRVVGNLRLPVGTSNRSRVHVLERVNNGPASANTI